MWLQDDTVYSHGAGMGVVSQLRTGNTGLHSESHLGHVLIQTVCADRELEILSQEAMVADVGLRGDRRHQFLFLLRA